jgi:cysteine desulfurase
MNISYLDYNATTPLHQLARNEVINAFDVIGNPSATHKLGLKARMVVDDARYKVAELFNLRQEQVIFTSGGTESNNLALANKKVLASSLEHSSVANQQVDTFSNLGELNHKLSIINYDIVSCCLVNSETGIIQNIEEVFKICAKHKVLLHVDATQAWGKIDFSFQFCNLMTLSAHKIGLAKGVGILLTDGKTNLAVLNQGGGQERGRRSGTENVQALASLHVVNEVLADKNKNIKQLRDYLETQIKQINPNAIIVGKNKTRVDNTSYIITPGVDSQTQVISMDMAGVCVSAGAACSSGDVKTSKVIESLGFNTELAKCGMRISLGLETTMQDIEKFLTNYKGIIK